MSVRSDKAQDERSDGMNKVQTTGGISLSPELFEQLYLAPKQNVHGHLRERFGNPTPIAIGGLMLCTTSLAMVLLEWQGAGGFAGAANVACCIYVGGLLLLLGGIGEWIIGNTFPAVLFIIHGGFWTAFGYTIIPSIGAYGAYSTTGVVADGLKEPQFFATFAFSLVAMAIVSTFFTIAGLRTNVALFVSLAILVPTFAVIASSFFAISHGQLERARTLQHAGGGLLFAVSCTGWYVFLSMLLASVDFPIALPLGDLSTVIAGRSSRLAGKGEV